MTGLRLIVEHRGDQAFYDLGPINHEVPPETLFAALPTRKPHVCADNDMCFIVNYEDGDLICHDREVSRELAQKLLDQDIDVALSAARAALNRVYAAMGSTKTVPVPRAVGRHPSQ